MQIVSTSNHILTQMLQIFILISNIFESTLGGKVSLNCPKTGYVANIEFKCKPFFTSDVNKVKTNRPHEKIFNVLEKQKFKTLCRRRNMNVPIIMLKNNYILPHRIYIIF